MGTASVTEVTMYIGLGLAIMAVCLWLYDNYVSKPEEYSLKLKGSMCQPGEFIRTALEVPPLNLKDSIGAFVWNAKDEEGVESVSLTREDTKVLSASIIRAEFDSYCDYQDTPFPPSKAYVVRYLKNAPKQVDVQLLYSLCEQDVHEKSIQLIVDSMVSIHASYLVKCMRDGFSLYGVILTYKES